MMIETNPSDFDDWCAALDLLQICFRDMHGRIDPPSSLLSMGQDDLRDLASAGALFLHRNKTGLVACLFGAKRPGSLYLSKLAVHPAARGRGLARALVGAAAAYARGEGLPALTLESRVELTENHATFRALGFRQTGESRHPGFDHPTSLSFTRAL